MATWNDLFESNKTGVRTSPEIALNFSGTVKDVRLVWDSDVPPGTSLSVEVTYFDGEDWSDWKPVTNNAPLEDVAPYLPIPGAKIQIRATLSNEDTIATPRLYSMRVVITSAYDSEYVWMSPVIDLRDYEPDFSMVVLDFTEPSGTEVVAESRTSYDGVAWGSWQEIVGNTFPAVGVYMQTRVTLKTNTSHDQTPVFHGMSGAFWNGSYRGIWTSDVIDVSDVRDRSSGSAQVQNTGESVVVLSRSSSASTGAPWSPWSVALTDGSLTHPENDFVQIMLLFADPKAEIMELTIAFDGEAELTLLTSAMTPGAEYAFTTLRDKLIIVNGRDNPMKWDGEDDFSPLGGSPPVLSMVATHHNRVWGVDAQNRSRVRYSDILDPETWPAFSFLDFNPEDGDYITAIMRYGQNLIVSKNRSMALLTGNMSSNYSITWLDSESGCTGPRAICQADKYVAYVSQDGIRFTDLNTSVLATERLIPSWQDINRRRLNQAAVVYWRNTLLAALPSAGSLVNNVVWAYDFLRNSWAIYRGWKVGSWLKFHEYGEEVLMAADSETGQVYRMMVDTYDDTVPVFYKWRSKDFHFGHPERFKLFRNIYLDIAGVEADSPLSVTMYVDGERRGTYTTTIPEGEGVKHVRRILPPLYDAVLGRSISIEIEGRCGIQGISIEYVVRGAVPGGDL